MITEDHLCLLFDICEQCQEKVMSGQSHDQCFFILDETVDISSKKKN